MNPLMYDASVSVFNRVRDPSDDVGSLNPM